MVQWDKVVMVDPRSGMLINQASIIQLFIQLTEDTPSTVTDARALSENKAATVYDCIN